MPNYQNVKTLWYSSVFFLSKITVLLLLPIFFVAIQAKTLDAEEQCSNSILIMNLHMENNQITLNSVYKAKIRLPKPSKKLSHSPNFFLAVNESGKTILHAPFIMPKKQYFDYINEETGELKGKETTKEKLDFVLKIPYTKEIEKIHFFETIPHFKQPPSSEKQDRKTSHTDSKSAEIKRIGTVELGTFVFTK